MVVNSNGDVLLLAAPRPLTFTGGRFCFRIRIFREVWGEKMDEATGGGAEGPQTCCPPSELLKKARMNLSSVV